MLTVSSTETCPPIHLPSVHEEIQDTIAGGGQDLQVSQLQHQLDWLDGLEGRAGVEEKHPDIRTLLRASEEGGGTGSSSSRCLDGSCIY